MSSSSYTSNLSLSQFESLDKPSWLQDYNSDMEKIDGACKNFTGTDGSSAGTAGFVPAPATTDADKFLKSDGTWAEAGGGSSITLYTTTGQNEDGAMTQKATTNMICKNGDMTKINIGGNTFGQGANTIVIGDSSSASSAGAIAVGSGAVANAQGGASFGKNASASEPHSVGLGSYAIPRAQGVVDVSAYDANNLVSYGYQGTGDAQRTRYRVISGVHEGENAHDVAIINQILKVRYVTDDGTVPDSSTVGELGDLFIVKDESLPDDSQLKYIYVCARIMDTYDPQDPVEYTWLPIFQF